MHRSVSKQYIRKGFVAAVGHEKLLPLNAGETVESTRLCQCIERPACQYVQVDAFDEIVDILEQAVRLPFFRDALHHRRTDTFDGTETEADVAVGVHRKRQVTLVDVRSEHLDAHAPAFVHKLGYFSDI